MLKKLHLLIVVSCLFILNKSTAQTSQLFYEDFSGGNGTFTLNSGGPVANTGANQWIVNNVYNGNGIYPNTTSQLKTDSGVIAIPDSFYLHIYDSTSTVGNCSYNNTIPSDNFAYLTTGICTRGFTNVHFGFYSVAQGDTSDYGSVYYSVEGGPWIQCGALKFDGDTIWSYQDISLPDFENHYSVQFGFRWTNINNPGANKISFGVDNINVSGIFSPVQPVLITMTSVSPDTVCAGTFYKLGYKVSQPFCSGSYQAILSDSVGNFSGDTTYLGTFSIGGGDTTGYVTAIAPVLSGACYRFRFDRVSTPFIKGVPGTICFNIQNCANTTTALEPTVLAGPDTLCDESVMDIDFYSTGIFNGNNQYIAQLSDATGSFAHPLTIGTSSDSTNYDPNQGSYPGTLSGRVPVTAPGCNYFIRIISTSPAYIPPTSQAYGPFCIRHCDITTNNNMDVQVCISDTIGAVDTITFKTDSWNDSTHYNTGNLFEAQLIDPYSYYIINTAKLGVVEADSSTKLVLRIPPYDSLFSLYYLFPGTYYLRVVSTNSNSHTDTLGTLIRLTIGYNDPVKPIVGLYDNNLDPDSVYCTGGTVNAYINNYNFLSNYEWQTSLDLGIPQPYYQFPPITVTFTIAATTGRFWFMARENDNGCFSEWSDTAFFTVVANPRPSIATSSSCLGDTVDIYAPFDYSTEYNWSVGGSPTTHKIISRDTNLIKVVFDSTGTYNVSVIESNQCGNASKSGTITVSPKPATPIVNPTISGVRDTIVLPGDSLKLNVTNYVAGQTYQWSSSLNVGRGSIFVYTPPLGVNSHYSPGLYWFIARVYDNGCVSDWSDTVWVDFKGTNGISSVGQMQKITIVPNPASDEVTVQIPPGAGVNKLELMDMTGKVLLSQPASDIDTKLNIEELPSGVYLIRVSGKGSRVFKVVKE